VRQAGQAAAFALAVLRAARRPAPAALLPLAAAAAQLRGEAVASLSGDGEFALRAPVRDPGRARSALRAAGANVRLLAPGARVSPLGEGLARLSGPGLRTVYGLVGATLVAASDERRARELAGAPVARLDHAKGGLAARADLTVLGRAIQGWLGLDTGPLGEAVAWARSEPGGVRGVLEVRIRSAR
jgi:hypothetical protein